MAKVKMDLCVLMDTTGSMHPWLEEAKRRVVSLLIEIPDAVKRAYGKDVVLRLAFVDYKDLPDHPVFCYFGTEGAAIIAGYGDRHLLLGNDL
jgi:hypothetical protein